MKKNLILLVSLFFLVFFTPEKLFSSDISLFKEISQSFENQYYPGTIEKVDLLQKTYPESVFIQPSLVLKAKSLINLGQYEMAIVTLENAITHMHTGKEGFAQCHYLLGKSYLYLKNYEKSLQSFRLCCELSLIDNEMEFYNLAIFYSGEIFYELKKYNEAYPLYEYVIQHGSSYSMDEYIDSTKKLMESYNKAGVFDKTINLIKVLDFDYFDNRTKNIMKIYAGEAFGKSKLYDEAYKVYENILDSKDPVFVQIALKNIFSLYHYNKIDVVMEEIIYNSEVIIDDSKHFLSELWIRLGIDEYNKNNYEKAEECFSNVKENFDIINLYRAKIILDRDSSDAGGKAAESLLKKCKNINNKEGYVKNLSDTYYSLLLQCKVQQNLWEDIPEIYNKITNPDNKSDLIISVFYYNNGQYEKVLKNTGILYCSALCHLGEYGESVRCFDELYENGNLSSQYLSDYGKALFSVGNYEKAYNIILQSEDFQKEYMCGLCKINSGDYDLGKKHFNSYIKQMSNSNDFIELAFYFKAMAEYKLGEYRNAYASFIRFNTEGGTEYFPYLRKSYKFAALSAMENGDCENAALAGKKVIEVSLNENDKKEGAIFCFEILCDCEKFDEAIELLLPYTKIKNEFTPEALFMIATVYEKQGKTEDAYKAYSKIFTEHENSKYSEEAMFRCGVIYYFIGDYITAYSRFNDYVYKYVKGNFLDAALYFSGDCALRLGEISKSIMINKNITAKFPDSLYTYHAYINLLNAYYTQEDYGKALEIANYLLNNYKQEAIHDGIGKKVLELEQIVQGSDRRIVEKMTQYENAGGSETKAGREVGAELVKLYAENYFTQKNAFNLAVELLEKQTEEDDYIYGAENAEFAGDYCRTINENEKAGVYYLTAAQFYIKIEKSIKAASTLYSAAEAFVASGLKDDAVVIADLLLKLYPDTIYAERVGKVVR